MVEVEYFVSWNKRREPFGGTEPGIVMGMEGPEPGTGRGVEGMEPEP